MFIELVDALRCPRPHEESWLVLSATRLEARHVREGILGCPVCRAEYPIRGGVADFRLTEVTAPEPTRSPETTELAEPEALAAMLALTDPLGFVVLTGEWTRRADALLDLLDAPPLLLVDPPEDVPLGPGLSGLRADAVLPIAAGAARGVAVDDAEPARVESAARTTRTGGRLVAPVRCPLPAGVRELARDRRVWVGEREAAPSAPVSLHVRRG